MHIQFGTGNVLCSWGTMVDNPGDYGLALEVVPESRPIGSSVVPDGNAVASDTTAILSFSSIESARVLQDMLNDMVGTWARRLADQEDEHVVADENQ